MSSSSKVHRDSWIESERLLYERIVSGHADELRAKLCDPVVYQYIDKRVPPTPDELWRSFVRKESGAPAHRAASETWIDYAVRLKHTAKAIGRVEATLLGDHAEVAYLFGRQHWGFGYARESVRWLQSFLLERHAVQVFWATVVPANHRSIALLEDLAYEEAARPDWPDKLLSYHDGDRVFRRVLA